MDDVATETGFEPEECLHVRAFVDHNRVTQVSGGNGVVPDLRSPVRIDRHGAAVDSAAVYEDWADHLRKWAKFLGPSGLLMIEGHPYPTSAIPPAPASNILLAFEYYHALSGQWPLAAHEISKAVAASGLEERVVASVPSGHAAVTIRHMRPRATMTR
jgi:hypothetical protein